MCSFSNFSQSFLIFILVWKISEVVSFFLQLDLKVNYSTYYWSRDEYVNIFLAFFFRIIELFTITDSIFTYVPIEYIHFDVLSNLSRNWDLSRFSLNDLTAIKTFNFKVLYLWNNDKGAFSYWNDSWHTSRTCKITINISFLYVPQK